jgi:hypothetical protein
MYKVALNTIILTLTLKTTYSEMVIDVHLTDLLSTIYRFKSKSIYLLGTDQGKWYLDLKNGTGIIAQYFFSFNTSILF